MRTKHKLFLIILFVSLGINLYSAASGELDVSPCDDTYRYTDEVAGGGIEIAFTDVKTLVQAYQNAHKDDKTAYKTTGFILSKKVCDELFKNSTANVLTLDLIEQDGQLNLAVKATHNAKSGIDTKAGSRIFVMQTFCPSDCSSW